MTVIGKLPKLPSQKKRHNSLTSFFKRRFKLPKLWKFKKKIMGVKLAKSAADRSKRGGSPFTKMDGGGPASVRMPGGSASVSRSGGRMTGRAPIKARGGARGIVGSKTR